MILAALGLLLGVLIRFLGERMEQHQIRYVSFYFGEHEKENAIDLEPDEFTTILERTSDVLSTTKVLRFISLLFLAPSFMTLTYLFLRSETQEFPVFLWQAIVLAGLFGILTGCSLMSRLDTIHHSRMEKDLPEWLKDREVSAPFLTTVLSRVWGMILSLVDPLLRVIDIQPQPAYLFESDGMFHLDMQTPVSNEDRDIATTAKGRRIRLTERTEEDMIEAIHRLDQTFAREIMKPINQVTAIRLSDYTSESLKELARITGFTRIPCYRDKITELIGFINIYDVLDSNEVSDSLEEFITRPLFFPEVARVDNVLSEMIVSRKQVAIVYDEFGATSGWLSREDIFEEIVGEVEDEYENPQNLVENFKDGYIVQPHIDLDDLNDLLGLDLTHDQCDTLAGFIYYRLGRTPRRGETIGEQGWTIRVAGLDNYRIRRVRLTPPAESES